MSRCKPDLDKLTMTNRSPGQQPSAADNIQSCVCAVHPTLLGNDKRLGGCVKRK